MEFRLDPKDPHLPAPQASAGAALRCPVPERNLGARKPGAARKGRPVPQFRRRSPVTPTAQVKAEVALAPCSVPWERRWLGGFIV